MDAIEKTASCNETRTGAWTMKSDKEREESVARAIALKEAFGKAGFNFGSTEWGWVVANNSTGKWQYDTEERDIERYVEDGIGNIPQIVAKYGQGGLTSADLKALQYDRDGWWE
jgi:hypothetical protein